MDSIFSGRAYIEHTNEGAMQSFPKCCETQNYSAFLTTIDR
jgi:hypothetical protein